MGTVLARVIQGVNWEWPVVLAAGVLLGGIAALGFYSMGVDDDGVHAR